MLYLRLEIYGFTYIQQSSYQYDKRNLGNFFEFFSNDRLDRVAVRPLREHATYMFV